MDNIANLTDLTILKTCLRCNKIKPITMFVKTSKTESGYSHPCKECHNEKNRLYHQEHPEKKHQYYQKNKAILLEKQKAYTKKHEERIKIRRREYYNQNKSHLLAAHHVYHKEYIKRPEVRTARREYRRLYYRTTKRQDYLKRYKQSIVYRLSNSIGSRINKSLKNMNSSKGYHCWEKLVGYTTKDLKNHIEKQFVVGMSWDNYGKWQVDHIVPISWFNYSSYDDKEFKVCWGLNNLQPLWAKDNQRKNSFYSDIKTMEV